MQLGWDNNNFSCSYGFQGQAPPTMFSEWGLGLKAAWPLLMYTHVKRLWIVSMSMSAIKQNERTYEEFGKSLLSPGVFRFVQVSPVVSRCL